jgi:Ca2+-binding RTX toxin-like protein
LTLNADGSYSYSANSSHTLPSSGVGEDIFTYTAKDGAGGVADTTLTLIVTRAGLDYLGGTANTTVHGGFGSKVLDGSAGGDTLLAGIGNQVLIGGPGDTLRGGLGIETFVFGPNFGLNTVKFFIPIIDKIQLPKSEFANFADVQQHMTQVGGNTVITYDAHDIITLAGVQEAHLHNANFIFA